MLLMLAARNGHETVVRLLVEGGLAVAATDEQGWTPLIAADVSGTEWARGGSVLLVEYGAGGRRAGFGGTDGV
jgi:ankyrin repeat protein